MYEYNYLKVTEFAVQTQPVLYLQWCLYSVVQSGVTYFWVHESHSVYGDCKISENLVISTRKKPLIANTSRSQKLDRVQCNLMHNLKWWAKLNELAFSACDMSFFWISRSILGIVVYQSMIGANGSGRHKNHKNCETFFEDRKKSSWACRELWDRLLCIAIYACLSVCLFIYLFPPSVVCIE